MNVAVKVVTTDNWGNKMLPGFVSFLESMQTENKVIEEWNLEFSRPPLKPTSSFKTGLWRLRGCLYGVEPALLVGLALFSEIPRLS